MPKPFPFKNVFLTGASSGIGLALARELAQRGCSLALVARRGEVLRGLVEELANETHRVLAYPLDVTDQAALVAAAMDADAQLGGVDLVIANAGIGCPITAQNPDLAGIRRTIDVNLSAALETLYALLPAMLARGHGHIAGISSMASWRGMPQGNVYSATKAALANALEGLRVELQGSGVGVSCIHPGFVRSAITDANDFPMPFFLEADRAATLMANALARRKASYTFPWQMRLLVKPLLRLLPNGLYDRLMLSKRELYSQSHKPQ